MESLPSQLCFLCGLHIKFLPFWIGPWQQSFSYLCHFFDLVTLHFSDLWWPGENGFHCVLNVILLATEVPLCFLSSPLFFSTSLLSSLLTCSLISSPLLSPLPSSPPLSSPTPSPWSPLFSSCLPFSPLLPLPPLFCPVLSSSFFPYPLPFSRFLSLPLLSPPLPSPPLRSEKGDHTM